MSTTEQALKLIENAGTVGMRSDALQAKLGIDNVAALLAMHVKSGTLMSCKVYRPEGGHALNEYRMSVKAGGGDVVFSSHPVGRPPTKPAAARKPEGFQPLLLKPRAEAKLAAPAPARPAVAKRAASAAAKPPLDDSLERGADLGRRVPAARQVEGRQHIGEVERGVPLPSIIGPLRQAMSRMQIGDSILLKGYSRTNIHNSAARQDISVVLEPEDDGMRVWRTR